MPGPDDFTKPPRLDTNKEETVEMVLAEVNVLLNKTVVHLDTLEAAFGVGNVLDEKIFDVGGIPVASLKNTRANQDLVAARKEFLEKTRAAGLAAIQEARKWVGYFRANLSGADLQTLQRLRADLLQREAEAAAERKLH